ncbi:MAG: heme ABC exporter ATP-binding protein CcmA [bacterium]|nr:heme ABC exporter ATP-binding protein CcmA [bacterium]MCP4966317.1 heme ABC exporter ATP-binding protein CcmA [bacterium]
MLSANAHVVFRRVAARIGVTTILRDVNLTVRAGESVGLFGSNGAGKTTLLRVIATLLRPSAGEAQVLGTDLGSSDRFSIRSRIGLIGHSPALYPELSLAANLEFSARIAGAPLAAANDALETVGLGQARDRLAGEASHGMQRRVEFARELMLQPELLLLDEPHSALDPSAVELVEHIVAGVLDRGGAVVLVSHDVDRVAPMVTRTAELTGGTVR